MYQQHHHNAKVVIDILQKKLDLTVAVLPSCSPEHHVKVMREKAMTPAEAQSLDGIYLILTSAVGKSAKNKRIELPVDVDEIVGLDELLTLVGTFCGGGQRDVILRIYTKSYYKHLKELLYTYIILYRPDREPKILTGWPAEKYLSNMKNTVSVSHSTEVG